MMEFTSKQFEQLISYITRYNNWIRESVDKPVRIELNVRPQELENIFNQIKILTQKLRQGLDGKIELSSTEMSLVKRGIIHTVRTKAFEKEVRERKTFNHDLRELFDDEMQLISEFTEQSWFKETVAVKPLKLSDFLSIHRAMATQTTMDLMKRVYDEKFQILLAPTLFLSDLSYYRTVCELRDLSVSVAYLDIDDFKSFNTKYGESTVDREVLPKFMNCLEAHVFGRGYAYRYGGDEYVVLLPNMSTFQAVSVFSEFQTKLEKLTFFNIDKHIEVSVGICEVNEDSILTDRGVEERAVRAKKFAKDSGKNSIAGFKEHTYADEDLRIF